MLFGSNRNFIRDFFLYSILFWAISVSNFIRPILVAARDTPSKSYYRTFAALLKPPQSFAVYDYKTNNEVILTMPGAFGWVGIIRWWRMP
jgi:hypothetical protein